MSADSYAAVKAASFTFNETDSSLDAATLSGDYAFFIHWTRSVNFNKVVRNYSYCYDTRRRNPIWAAYPLHPVYREGGYGRTSPDPWSPGPALAGKYQSKIYRADGPDGSDSYQYWSSNTLDKFGLSGIGPGDTSACRVNGAAPTRRSTARPSIRPTSPCSPTMRPSRSARCGDVSSARTVLREIAAPVSRIEEQTGFTFFPDVPDEVKEQCNPSDWGF